MTDLDTMLQPGNKIRLFYDKGNPNNNLMHIRAIVDDDQIVYRWWSRRKQNWRYVIVWRYMFELWHKDNNLTLVK